ncbi:MAG TPA: LamG-like jellyroll fold domain-containing protein, partial [Terriglobales bacterium]|nr:LamG-like jellyroll fold domain-containing protein [Terriglobales bacterium]
MTPSSVRFLVRDFGFIRRASLLAAIFASVITLLLPGVSVAQSAPGITAAYALNENAGVTTADSSGNANNGTLTNGPTWGTGKYGSSVHFDGVNDFISVPSATSLNIGAAGTIEAWVKIDSLGRWHSVLSKGTANNDSKQNYAMEITTANKVYCILGSGNSNRTATSTSTLAAGQFYHLACAWNGTNLQLYINGTLNTSVTQNLTPAANTSPLYIGQFAGNADQLQGYIDEVRIYGRALSATEIQTDMNTPLGVSAPPDTTNPTASMTAPLNGASLSGSTTVSANASDNVGVVGVQFLLDGSPLGTEDTTAPYSISWDTTTTSNGSHNLSARARDAAGNLGTSTSISVSVSNAAPPPPGGLVAAYALNEGSGTAASDLSGNSNNGTLTNGPTWAAGKYGLGVNFDGVNDYVQVNNSSTLGLGGTGTLEAWVKVNTLGKWHGIIAKGSSNSDPANSYAIEINNSNNFLCILGNGVSASVLTSSSAVAAGQFYHIACTWNGATALMYVNGTQNASAAQGVTPSVNTAPLTIGQYGGNSDPTSGIIDEVRIYNRALSATEIQTDMNTALVAAQPPDTTNPTATMTAPLNNATVSGTIAVSANASDNVGVVGVQFLLDGSPLGAEDTTAPYSISWDSTGASNAAHTLSARARDAAGNLGTSAGVNVTVNNIPPDTTNPTSSMTSPLNNATVSGTIAVSANASDNVGVVGVQFLLDGSPLGAEDTTAPYSISWDSTGASNASHTLSARARDAAGNLGTSTSVNVTVNNTPLDSTPPTISLTAPLNNATVSGTVTLSANATDNVAIAGVQFFVDGSPLGAEDTTAPYSISWNSTTTADGAHSLTARARDTSGNPAMSGAISITVANTIPPPPSGLMSAYPLNEGSGTTAVDISGHNNNGTLTNGPTWTAAKYGTGVAFDGVNDYIRVNDSATLGLSNTGTIEAWVKVNAVGIWHGILAKGSSTTDPSHNYAIEINNDNRFLCILGDGTNSQGLTSNATVAAGQFYHIACAWNGTALSLYVNGTLNTSV